MATVFARKSGIRLLALAAVLMFSAGAYAQDQKTCHVVFCKDDAKKFLVFEPDGKWMDTVRWFGMSIKDGQAAVKLTMWKGVYKPTKPVTEVRMVAQIQAVSEADFQQTVDDMQNTQQVGMLKKDVPADGAGGAGNGKPVQLTQ